MKILIVCSGNAPNFIFEKHQAFIYDQIQAVKKEDPSIHFDYFFIKGKGLNGYFSNRKELIGRLENQDYNIVHAHFSLSALLANLQRKAPVISTFHGSDINLVKLRIVSAVVERLSSQTIYVSQKLQDKAILPIKFKSKVLPCGVDFELFKPVPKEVARQALGFKSDTKYVLFSSSFGNPVKNYPLARRALELIDDPVLELVELKNYNRQEVALLMSAVDAAILTSFTEGSPQFVKEALACNCPVVSTDVGDVRYWMESIGGCYITSFEPEDVSKKLRQVLHRPQAIKAREAIRTLDNRLIAQQLIQLYNEVLIK